MIIRYLGQLSTLTVVAVHFATLVLHRFVVDVDISNLVSFLCDCYFSSAYLVGLCSVTF